MSRFMDKKKIVATFMIVFAVMLSSFAFYTYQLLYTPNFQIDREDRLLDVPRGTTFKQLQNRLYDEGYVNDLVAFSFLARVKNLDESLKAGMYLIRKDMSNMEVVNMLLRGTQEPVKLTFSNARMVGDLASVLTRTLEMDSAELAPYLLSDSVARLYGFDAQNFISMFLPNTYEVYWTVRPMDLLDRMKLEYDRYWNEDRKRLADSIGLTPQEVATLASIVDWETNKMDEAPRLAGVYMNRLKRGIPLQADPTVVFAVGDFSIRRVLKKHTELDSPYNTYMYPGLPPGPIMLPSIASVEAVLHHEAHKYLYFCAKDDFSGYHAFAKTLIEHNQNALKFQNALNQERIYR